jgi:hypothetical protein
MTMLYDFDVTVTLYLRLSYMGLLSNFLNSDLILVGRCPHSVPEDCMDLFVSKGQERLFRYR